MPTLPPEWQTTDITLLAHTARTYLSTLEATYEMNRSQWVYLQAASAELPPENPHGHPYQHPRQQPTGTPSHLPPAPTHPPPVVPHPAHGTLRMLNGRVDIRTEDQRAIIKEIGYHQHSPEHIIFWKNKGGPTKFYYHLTDHQSITCYKLYTAMHHYA